MLTGLHGLDLRTVANAWGWVDVISTAEPAADRGVCVPPSQSLGQLSLLKVWETLTQLVTTGK
jgi:hypothetical protein